MLHSEHCTDRGGKDGDEEDEVRDNEQEARRQQPRDHARHRQTKVSRNGRVSAHFQQRVSRITARSPAHTAQHGGRDSPAPGWTVHPRSCRCDGNVCRRAAHRLNTLMMMLPGRRRARQQPWSTSSGSSPSTPLPTSTTMYLTHMRRLRVSSVLAGRGCVSVCGRQG